MRVPDGLELAEGGHQLLAVHDGQEFAPRLAVAVLARERAAVGHHQLGRLVHEAPELLDPVGGLEVEVDAVVDAALAEVAVEHAVVAVLVHERAQIAQVGAHLVGRHAGILPPGPLPLLPGRVGAGADAGLADLPHPRHLRRVGVEGHVGRIGHVVQREHQLPGLLGGLLEVVGAELHDQEAAACGEQVGGERVLPLDGAQQAVVEGLQADGSGGEDLGHVVAGRGDVGVAQHQEHARLGAGDQAQQGLEDRDAGALAAHQRPGDVEAVLGQQLVEAEARDPAGDVGEARADQVGVAVAQVAQPGVDLAAAAARADDGLQVLRRRWARPAGAGRRR